MKTKTNLFKQGDFILHSGETSTFKIDCDALTKEDFAALASFIVPSLPPFGSVRAIPRGGSKFALALAKYMTPGNMCKLIVDDVWTTGGSMQAASAESPISCSPPHGVVIFARGKTPSWVTAIFRLG